MTRAHYQDMIRRRLRAGDDVTRAEIAHEMQIDGLRYADVKPVLDDLFKGADVLRPGRAA